MADIQIREDRMKANEEILRAKRERQRQQVSNGFSVSKTETVELGTKL